MLHARVREALARLMTARLMKINARALICDRRRHLTHCADADVLILRLPHVLLSCVDVSHAHTPAASTQTIVTPLEVTSEMKSASSSEIEKKAECQVLRYPSLSLRPKASRKST